MPQEFSGILLEDFDASEGFDHGTGRSELETSALDPSSASSILSWPLPSTNPYSYTQPSLPYNDTPTMPSITTAHADPPIVKLPMLPPSKITARPGPKEHSAEEWERQRLTFTQLYTTEDKPLKEVMKIMENEYRFRATPRQYKRRIEQWKLDKNIKENDMRIILRKDLKRKREGKKSEFRICGREIEPKKIQRFTQRYKATEESILEFNVETPCYIDCDTPAPTILNEDIRHHIVEVNIPDSTILSPPVLELVQDRETQIVGTRNQFWISSFGNLVVPFPLLLDSTSPTSNTLLNSTNVIFYHRLKLSALVFPAVNYPHRAVFVATIAVFPRKV
ncbi:hypothetical protein BPAE_0112g00340 [Botrytis paeoniae]|uniref:Clr5 domain-containing protein n=1 Tax=Botrytis paeoniae TaxID=278948 RepID=A0A4Z1FI14_9HELO|nr:hypothetical protein BPAE_0112g00340 [Botrytis paeoniae]